MNNSFYTVSEYVEYNLLVLTSFLTLCLFFVSCICCLTCHDDFDVHCFPLMKLMYVCMIPFRHIKYLSSRHQLQLWQFRRRGLQPGPY
jgi:hypothetical protein